MPASFEKLSIRGVRSFSPDDEDQIIEFYFPLTIIVGANGCGKTTIIECLRYAVTGGLPPGNKSGQAFVHDPKHSKTAVVKASVKLRFNNMSGKAMLVHRTMEVSQKKSTITFKSLDGVIKTQDESGRTVSSSHTCSEMEKTIPLMLGVSKAVLDNVVFVHQEDSCWVLQEGAVLKTKFDAIFDSTKYAKALEAIKETKKRYANKVKDLKAELNLLQGHKHAASSFRREYDQTNENLSNVTDKIQELNQQIDDEMKKKTEFSNILSKVGNINQEVLEKTHQMEKESVRLETIKSTLKEDKTSQSLAELEALLSGFDASAGETLSELEGKKDYADNIKKDNATLQKRQHELIQRKGVLIGEKSNYENDLKRRVEIITQIHTNYDLKYDQSQGSYREGSFVDLGTQRSILSQGSVTTLGRLTMLSQESIPVIPDEELALFQRVIGEKRAEFATDLANLKKQHQQEDDRMQKGIGESMTDVRSLEAEFQRIVSDIEKTSQLLSRTTASSNRVRKSELDFARKEYEDAIRMRDEAFNDQKRVSIPKSISDAHGQIEDITNSLEIDRKAQEELRKSVEAQNEISFLDRQVQEDLENMIDFKAQSNFLLQKYSFQPALLIGMTGEQLIKSTQDMLCAVSIRVDSNHSDLSDAAEKVRTMESRLSQVSAVLNHSRQLSSEKNSRCQDLSLGSVKIIKQIVQSVICWEESLPDDDKIPDHERIKADADPQAIIEYLKKRIFSFDVDDPDSVSRTIKKLKFFSKKQNACLCCQRGFNGNTLADFSASMDSLADSNTSVFIQADKERAEKAKASLKKIEEWRTQASENMDDWYEWKRISKELENIEKTVGEKKLEEDILSGDLSAAKDTEKKLKQEQEDLRQIAILSKRLSDDADKINVKMKQVESKRSALSRKAPSAGGRDLRTLDQEIACKMQTRDDISASISKWYKELSAINDRVNDTSHYASESEKKLREAEEKHSRDQEMNEKRNQLQESHARLESEQERVDKELKQSRSKLTNKERDRMRARASSETLENKASSKLTEFNTLVSKFDEISTSINLFVQSKKIESLDDVEADMAAVSNDMKRNYQKLKDNEPVIEMLKTKLNDKQGMRDNVSKNIDLKKMYDKILVLKREHAELESKLENVEGYKTAKKDIQESSQKIQQYTSEKDRNDGVVETYRSQMRELKRKLKTPEYDDVDERHRVKMIECEISSLAVSDLEKYYNALDKALLRYHGMKIAEINKIIAELWTLTYKGEDITSIRITSDQEEGSKASRSYNYRVVMTKGNTELDMRGRCSAGQRVLASIVIRLALAETFCLSCGVMALDEPTTNLDHANKLGLASALARIISTRSAQKNFQLIIITHDEDFVAQMKMDLATHSGLSMPEKYFIVSREEAADGCFYSKIHSVDWDEM